MSITTYNREGDYWRERTLTITGMSDGDQFDPKYFSVPADAKLTMEEATKLATKLFGRHITVTETITLRKTVG